MPGEFGGVQVTGAARAACPDVTGRANTSPTAAASRIRPALRLAEQRSISRICTYLPVCAPSKRGADLE